MNFQRQPCRLYTYEYAGIRLLLEFSLYFNTFYAITTTTTTITFTNFQPRRHISPHTMDTLTKVRLL